MPIVLDGYDYTMPISEYRRVETALYKSFIDPKEEIEVLTVQNNDRIRLRFKSSQYPPHAIELDDILRETLSIKGLRRVPHWISMDSKELEGVQVTYKQKQS